MQLKRKLGPRTRHTHTITIEDSVWDALSEYCIRHNQYPGEVVEAALRKHIKIETEDFG